MPRSERSQLIKRLSRLLRVEDRYVDMGARLRIYRRAPDGQRAEPAELLERVYGGRYDRIARAYVGPPQKIEEISCHAGQLPLLLFDQPGTARVLSIGPPGGGKTFGITRRALLNILMRPNSVGGLVAPTNDRRIILWRDLIDLLQPLGWIEDVNEAKKEIVTANRVIVQIIAAKRPSIRQGSPIQGRSWDWAGIDESQNCDEYAQLDIDERGRRAGTKYVVFESATNADISQFRLRLEKYKENPKRFTILRYTAQENPWVEPEYWERLKDLMSERDYRSRILAEDVPPEQLTYPRFSFKDTVRPRALNGVDLTPIITQERYGEAFPFIIAQDFGVLVSASILLKVYREPNTGEHLWWAIDEITSYSQTAADQHAKRIARKYNPADCLVIADPHINTADVDKSDYHLMRREGFRVVPASSTGNIRKKHRVTMVNVLLEDANGKRRLFVDCDANRQPAAKKLVQALLTQQISATGELESEKKDYRDSSHWTAAIGYGLWPFEKLRGQTMQERFTGVPEDDDKTRTQAAGARQWPSRGLINAPTRRFR